MAYLGREAAKAPIVTADLPNDGVTLAKMTGGTDGQIITYDASGDPVAVGPGSDGQVLTSTGAGSPPAFEAAAGGFASGTKMIFNQTAAPTGWTKVTGSGNDTALRVTTGTVGTGGSVAFETALASQTVPVHTLITAETPSHLHTLPLASGGGVVGSQWMFGAGFSGSVNSGNTGGGGTHGHGSIDLNVSYVDVIIATKD